MFRVTGFVSHELRQPLCSIQVCSELLLKEHNISVEVSKPLLSTSACTH